MRFLLPLLLLSCGAPSAEDLASTRGGRIEAYFNEPGTRAANMWEPDVVEAMIELIDGSTASIDFAVMGFGREPVIDAFIRAHDRGVKIRMVGDAGHLYNSGYERFLERHIPLVSGNMNHIMHDKFMVVDDRFVFTGTANWTDTDLRHNSNNFVLIDSPPVAARFNLEFDQMFGGKFGHTKKPLDGNRVYQVGDTEVEVWFSPNEDAMGRILELVDAAQESVRFTIFAFTKDQLGSLLIKKQEDWAVQDAAEGVADDADFRDRRSVAGMIDQSQLHSNGQYHEVYRLLGAEIPLRMDGNDNSKQPGDYQAGGGRLHSKTLVIDAYGENPMVITGSFNWSASATTSNDEFLLVLKGPRIAKMFDGYFESLWENGRNMGVHRMGEDLDGHTLSAGDVVINEIMWFGAHPEDPDGNDQFIELRNTTDRDIRLDMWQLQKNEESFDDVLVGIPPGSVLPANDVFTILDHTMEVYVDGEPQDEVSAFAGGDLVLNAYNDNRQARLYLKNGSLDFKLLDPAGTLMDRAGNGAPPFAGGPDGTVEIGDDDVVVGRSMERRSVPGDGAEPASWYTCTLTAGGAYVNADYKAIMIGSPGEENSPEP